MTHSGPANGHETSDRSHDGSPAPMTVQQAVERLRGLTRDLDPDGFRLREGHQAADALVIVLDALAAAEARLAEMREAVQALSIADSAAHRNGAPMPRSLDDAWVRMAKVISAPLDLSALRAFGERCARMGYDKTGDRIHELSDAEQAAHWAAIVAREMGERP